MSKIVVLGSAGFIGSAVCKTLTKKNIAIDAIATSSVGATLDANARWLGTDLRDCDTVFLCAGRTGGVGRMARDPMSFLFPNVRIHLNVFEACARENVRRVVCVQSTTGYANSNSAMLEDEYLEGALHPAYEVPGNAHRFIYRVAQMMPFEVVFFRPSNVYGPGNNFDPQHSHVIEATVRKVAERQDPFVIWGTGQETRDAIYIDDLAEAMTLGIHCPPGAYNVASGEEMSVNEIARLLLTAHDLNPSIVNDLTKPTAIATRRVDISKARQVLGWRPRVSMRDGLVKTLSWYLSHREASAA